MDTPVWHSPQKVDDDEGVAEVSFSSPSVGAGMNGVTSVSRRRESTDPRVYPPQTTRLSLEYIGCVLGLVGILGKGFLNVAALCAEHRSAVVYLRSPRPFFAFFGSVAYDAARDLQVGSFVFHFKKFLLLYSGMGLVLWLLRTLSDLDNCRVRAVCPRLATFCSRRHCIRFLFVAMVGTTFVVFSHGTHFFFLFLLTGLNYALFKGLQRCRRVSLGVYLILQWAIHVALLYLNEAYSGYERVYWIQKLVPSSSSVHWGVVGTERQPLWRTRMRWFLAYRMYVLRMISFNYDMWEANRSGDAARRRALHKHQHTCVECAKLREQFGKAVHHEDTASETAEPQRSKEMNASTSVERLQEKSGASPLDESLWCYKLRTEYSRDTSEYTYLNYMAYLLYMPIYLAGPITSFNAFVSHMHTPSKAMPLRSMLRYIARIAVLYGMMEFLLHFVFVKAVSAAVPVLWWFPVGSQAFFMYYYLAYLYLKFSFIWKTSRLFSMWCGVEVPEDMRRCFSNTFSVRDFWRDWHASFNLWIVRYMYIPMGGRRRVLFSIAPIFFFIAIWHDHALHLMKWALCIVVMFVLEILVSGAFDRLAKAFAREMERVREYETSGNTSRRNSNGDNDSMEGGKKGSDGCTQRGFRLAARWAATRLTPRQRRGCHRALRVGGGSITVFALIVSNLIGYNVHTDIRGIASQTDKTIESALKQTSVSFFVWLSVVLVLASFQGVMWREMAAQELEQARRKYGLSASLRALEIAEAEVTSSELIVVV